MQNEQDTQTGNRLLSALRRIHRRWLGDQSGAFLTEYAIVISFMFLAFFIAVEFSYLKVREVALDRAVDRSFRELRLGLINNPDHDVMKARICADQLSFLLPNCDDNLLLEVRQVPKTNWTIGAGEPICLDTTPPDDYEPPIVYSNGGQNDLMVARACLIQRPIFPVFDLISALQRYDDLGNFALISISAFVNEPT